MGSPAHIVGIILLFLLLKFFVFCFVFVGGYFLIFDSLLSRGARLTSKGKNFLHGKCGQLEFTFEPNASICFIEFRVSGEEFLQTKIFLGIIRQLTGIALGHQHYLTSLLNSLRSYEG